MASLHKRLLSKEHSYGESLYSMKVVRIDSTDICPFVQVDAIHAFPTMNLLLVFDEVTGA